MAEEKEVIAEPTATVIRPANTTIPTKTANAETTATPYRNADQSNTQQSSIGDLMSGIIDALVAIVNGFVTVLQDNAQTIAEITVVGGIIYGAIRLFGGAFGQLRGLVGV